MRTTVLLCGSLFLASIGHASIITYTATMSGSQETPPNASTGTGFATVTLDTVLQTLTVNESFSGLIGGTASAAHIHCCSGSGIAAVVAVPFTGFPVNTSGTYSQTFDLTLAGTYNGAFVTANGGTTASAETALIAGLGAGQAYVNIHDSTFPGGEIRGQLVITPEPSTWLMAGFALILAAGWRGRRMLAAPAVRG
jgi:hypothetical protein